MGTGTGVQTLQIDLNRGIWVVRTRFEPVTTSEKHYHTGPVFAVTLAGSWYYKEYPNYKTTEGSYLYEPAHSVHALTVPASNNETTDVWFAITGANLNMNEKGDVTSVADAHSILTTYRQLCRDKNFRVRASSSPASTARQGLSDGRTGRLLDASERCRGTRPTKPRARGDATHHPTDDRGAEVLRAATIA